MKKYFSTTTIKGKDVEKNRRKKRKQPGCRKIETEQSDCSADRDTV